MNREEKIKRWQASIDDDLLEEAQRPLPRGSAALRRGGLAACLCAAALALVLALPGHGSAETASCADTITTTVRRTPTHPCPPRTAICRRSHGRWVA